MKLTFRQARESDLEYLILMLADDALGSQREDPSGSLNQRYIDAFKAITKDPNNELIVLQLGDKVVGMLQLTFIPCLSHIGSRRCLIENVRVASDYRGRGIGATIIKWVIDRATERHCCMVQLTSDKQRPDAIRFYESHGFKATHEGFKYKL